MKAQCRFRYALVHYATPGGGFYRGERRGRYPATAAVHAGDRDTTVVTFGASHSMDGILSVSRDNCSVAGSSRRSIIRRADRFRRCRADGDFGNIHDSLSFFRNNYDAFRCSPSAQQFHPIAYGWSTPRKAAPTAAWTRPSDDESVELNDIDACRRSALIDPLERLTAEAWHHWRSGAGRPRCRVPAELRPTHRGPCTAGRRERLKAHEKRTKTRCA